MPPKENDKLIFETMCQLQCADRETLCNTTGLARTTVLDALHRLEREQAVVPFIENNGCPGRPKTIYMLNPKYGELSIEEWRRLKRQLWQLYRFFKALAPEDRLYCLISEEWELYGEVKQFCTQQCGVRLGCMERNQDGSKNV